ncbi:DUF4124 domain-containing protein [Acidovorax sp. DW039]|uniref:hypothetical protein n=1 Tax=Acidovorax sp. DW039 TaxID=3095606 RepID=UPI003088CD4C|nr:DUF4124 domain-containing protein [Acidovorax sp. DW039]
MISIKPVLLASALLFSTQSWAVNKCTAPDGKTVYQDAPCPGSGITVAEDLERRKSQQPANNVSSGTRNKEEDQAQEQAQEQARRRAEQTAMNSDAGLELAKKRCKNGVPENPVVGMSEADFRGCTQFGVLFPPTSVNTTETAAGVLKQYVYSADLNAGIRFVYTRNGVVSAIQR